MVTHTLKAQHTKEAKIGSQAFKARMTYTVSLSQPGQSETLSQKNRFGVLKKPAEPIKEILALGEMSLFSYSHQNPEKLKKPTTLPTPKIWLLHHL